MIPIREYAGRRVAVFGLGRTGIAAAKALAAGGAEVSAWDDDADTRSRAESAGVATDDISRRDWGDVEALVLSPGVPLTHPKPHRVVELANAVGAPVIGDVELFARAINAMEPGDRPKIVGVTGTNGKSTTTALIGHILAASGRDARVGGNIGDAVLGLAPPKPGAIYVLELSSYQLDLTASLCCDVALLLNFTPDHIDRHGDMAGYVRAKRRIFRNQTRADAAIIGVDDPLSQDICTEMTAAAGRRVIPVSAGRVLGRGVYALGRTLYDALEGKTLSVLELADAPALPGRHNAQNIAAAYAACRALGLTPRTIADAIRSFPGLAHRLEPVGVIGAARFVNDSKATNADATAQALACFENIYWIAGGQAKEGGIAALEPFFNRIAKAYLIGEAADAFARTLEGKVAFVKAETLDRATELAARDALKDGRPEPVVLLSPACASFDQFRNFEHRGDMFRIYVRARLDRPREGAA